MASMVLLGFGLPGVIDAGCPDGVVTGVFGGRRRCWSPWSRLSDSNRRPAAYKVHGGLYAAIRMSSGRAWRALVDLDDRRCTARQRDQD